MVRNMILQTLKAFKEAKEHNGPSLIIAYSPCISQGILGGLSNQLEEQKILVEVGYNLLMRYNPEEDKLTIDSKEPDFSNYDVVFERELRYRNLENINESFKGSAVVLTQIVNYDYLWAEIRVKGGAYGCGLSIGRNNNVSLGSYRDPNVKNTYEVFNNIVKIAMRTNLRS